MLTEAEIKAYTVDIPNDIQAAQRPAALCSMKDETLNILNAALDALWAEVGNGYGTEYQQLVHELQKAVDAEAYNRKRYKAETNGHKYASGETRTLTGLESYPEYNGEKVEIIAIRDDGEHGKAYYVKGRINEVFHWVYEYRLA